MTRKQVLPYLMKRTVKKEMMMSWKMALLGVDSSHKIGSYGRYHNCLLWALDF